MRDMATPETIDNKGFDDASRPHSTQPETQQDRPMTEASWESHDPESREIKLLGEEHAHLDLEQLAMATRKQEGNPLADRFRFMFGCQWLSKACGMAISSSVNLRIAKTIQSPCQTLPCHETLYTLHTSTCVRNND